MAVDHLERRGNAAIAAHRVERGKRAAPAAAAHQRAWTAEPVTIYRSGAVVRGTGFESRVAEEATSIKGRVRATFMRGTTGEPVPSGRP